MSYYAKNNYTIVTIAIMVGLFSFLVSCSNSSTKYDRLCGIYTRIVNQPIDRNKKEVDINIAVYDEMPEFYEKSFEKIMLSDPDKRYDLLKKVAEIETEKTWDCKVIEDFYSTPKGKSSDR